MENQKKPVTRKRNYKNLLQQELQQDVNVSSSTLLSRSPLKDVTNSFNTEKSTSKIPKRRSYTQLLQQHQDVNISSSNLLSRTPLRDVTNCVDIKDSTSQRCVRRNYQQLLQQETENGSNSCGSTLLTGTPLTNVTNCEYNFLTT